MLRRDFLKLLGFAGGAAALPWGLGAGAEETPQTSIDPEHRFVFVYFDGGWDTTMCLDPRDPALYDAPRDGIQLAWSMLGAYGAPGLVRPPGSNIAFGPVMSTFAKHYDVSCVVRGMSMDTLTHDVGRRYFLTGKPPSGPNARGSSHGSNAVDQLGRAHASALLPIANLSIDTESYYEGNLTEARPFRVGAGNALQLLFAFKEGYGDPIADLALRKTIQPKDSDPSIQPLARYREKRAACDPSKLDRHGLLSQYRASQAKAAKNIAANLGDHFDATKPGFAATLARYGATPFDRTPGAICAVAWQALSNRISNAVTMRIQGGLDTHTAEWATEQPRRLKQAFDALATFFDDLKKPDPDSGARLIDKTTVVMFSEFSRTPLLNGVAGRDHSLTNACLLAGAGVPHNKVIGASSNQGMAPMRIDPATGLPTGTQNGVMLRPQHVMASVFQSLGYATTQFQTTGIPALVV